jgi:hypothetical protein
VSARVAKSVVSELAGVAVGGALLLVAVDLTDERINVDDEPLIAGAGAGRPRPLQRQAEDLVQLAHVPERERTQERAER